MQKKKQKLLLQVRWTLMGSEDYDEDDVYDEDSTGHDFEDEVN